MFDIFKKNEKTQGNAMNLVVTNAYWKTDETTEGYLIHFLLKTTNDNDLYALAHRADVFSKFFKDEKEYAEWSKPENNMMLIEIDVNYWGKNTYYVSKATNKRISANDTHSIELNENEKQHLDNLINEYIKEINDNKTLYETFDDIKVAAQDVLTYSNRTVSGNYIARTPRNAMQDYDSKCIYEPERNTDNIAYTKCQYTDDTDFLIPFRVESVGDRSSIKNKDNAYRAL